jgi:diacylglycerol kinase family enzyme
MDPITIILNESSGSASSKSQALEEAVRDAGIDAAFARVSGKEIAAAAERAAGRGDVLVAAGGDGTVSTVAAVAVNTRSTFGVIPLGTLNHFARDAGIPVDLQSAVATIAAGHTQLLNVGDMNGTIFLNNASLGIYPKLVWEREVERGRGRRKWPAFAVALFRTWQRYPIIRTRMTVDGVPLERSTPFVFVGNGEYQAEGLGVGKRESLASGVLSAYLAPGVDRYEFLMLPARALMGRLAADVKFESFRGCEVNIEPRSRAVDVALDGELRTVAPPLRCTVRTGALRTLLPEAL